MNSPILANIVVDTFLHGGVIMWPLLVLSLFALAVVGERLVWWLAWRRARDQARLIRAYNAIANGDRREALKLARGSEDPRLRVVAYALEHPETSTEIATQVSISDELGGAQRFLGALDTIITLAPLLGLLGTVTGIMQSFKFVGGDQELAAAKVSGGIGEALIATAVGLGIAIFTLIPFNLFGGKAEKLEAELETVAKNLLLLPEKAKQKAENDYDLSTAQR
jgi:biopolymer transport protein ExbB